MTIRIAVVLATAGCALTNNAPPRPLRHFTPQVETQHAGRADRCGALTLGRVAGSAHLRGAIVHRTSPVEVALYETLRWTDHPDVFVRRALVDQLFVGAGLVRTYDARSGLVLEVDVLAFEQVDQPAPAGRVQLHFELRADRQVLRSGLLVFEQPARSTAIDDIVTAIGRATVLGAAEVATQVGRDVRTRASCPVP